MKQKCIPLNSGMLDPNLRVPIPISYEIEVTAAAEGIDIGISQACTITSSAVVVAGEPMGI